MPILGLKSLGPTHPPHFSLEPLIRPNILALQPYRCARDDYDSGILLDANENAIGPSLPFLLFDTSSEPSKVNGSNNVGLTLSELESLNRYPSPTHDDLKRRIASFRGVPNEDWVFLGVGSDEVVDLLFRVLCVPGKDRVLVTPPTYGMYKVCAAMNDVGVVSVPLITEGGKFQLDEEKLEEAFIKYPEMKMIFICSPNNPTATLIPIPVIRRIAENKKFKGVVVVDEAYIDFAPEGSSAVGLVKEFGNVCVTQTLSKGFGLAGIRLGYLIAPPPLIQILTNTKAPYNVSVPTASLALSALSKEGIALMSSSVQTLNKNRSRLIDSLKSIKGIGGIIGGNHSNFIMAQIVSDGKADNVKAAKVYKEMAEEKGVVVRFRGNELGCEGCLRITVGTEEECQVAVDRLKELLE
ncbi:histidinol-phosphate transaminase [Tremella mesenterica]|uniref:histidinol-phosphate transaminase n=1 Tax=Tremella mesenterica TaxID=5217 RepID=A0A4Q1B985_TREME|nr:histidinol-phosphate transaminase [Tremella mesenterica]